jgi:GNAT superfamily N-acetyltransferase
MRLHSQYRHETVTTLEVVSELTVREIPVADTRPLRQQILRPHQTLEELAGHEPAEATAVGAFLHGQLVSVGFVAPEGGAGSWRIRGMATVPEARGRGAGTAVLDALVTHARERGATRVWCNARTPARSLYERAGFVVASDEFEVPQIGPHFVMERNIAAASC